MPTYHVHLTRLVSTVVTVEAASPQQATVVAYDSSDMPGGLTQGAFGASASVDECGEWEPIAVTDAAG
jgi:hypothetical protein